MYARCVGSVEELPAKQAFQGRLHDAGQNTTLRKQPQENMRGGGESSTFIHSSCCFGLVDVQKR